MTTSNEHNNAPAVPQDMRLVPVWLLERVEQSLGSFTSDEGWSQSDMDTMDSVSALLAAAPAPAPAQEPFGYFRAEPFGWTDCAATDEGAIALYEHPAKPAQEVGLTGYIPLLEEVASSLEDYKNDAPWGSWDRERLERLYAIIAALRAKGGKHA